MVIACVALTSRLAGRVTRSIALPEETPCTNSVKKNAVASTEGQEQRDRAPGCLDVEPRPGLPRQRRQATRHQRLRARLRPRRRRCHCRRPFPIPRRELANDVETLGGHRPRTRRGARPQAPGCERSRSVVAVDGRAASRAPPQASCPLSSQARGRGSRSAPGRALSIDPRLGTTPVTVFLQGRTASAITLRA